MYVHGYKVLICEPKDLYRSAGEFWVYWEDALPEEWQVHYGYGNTSDEQKKNAINSFLKANIFVGANMYGADLRVANLRVADLQVKKER